MQSSTFPSFLPFTSLSPDEMAQSLCSTLAMASVGIATLRLMEQVLPQAAGEVERESNSLTEHFMTLARYVESQGEAAPQEVRDALQGVVMRLQFQDRNSQMVENTMGIMSHYRALLETTHAGGESIAECDVLLGRAISTTVETILSNIRLSDIRTGYEDALRKANVHLSNDDTPRTEARAAEDIELF